MLLGVVQAFVLAASGFDDDEPPEFVKQRNMVIPIGNKKYVSIPMPLGPHVLPNFGRILTEYAMSGFKKSAKKASELFGVLAEAFNPIGNAGMSAKTLTPTLLDPLVALGENRDWTGKRIYKEDRSQLAPTPGHARAKDTSSIWAKSLSRGINWVSGGTKYQPGWASPTPDQIDYLIGQATGGVGRELTKLGQSASALITGEDLPPHKIPLVGRLYGDANSQSAAASRFYEHLREMNLHEAEIKGRSRDNLPIDDYLRKHPEASLFGQANGAERQVNALLREKRMAIEMRADREKVKAIDKQIETAMRQFNDAVNAMERKPVAPAKPTSSRQAGDALRALY